MAKDAVCEGDDGPRQKNMPPDRTKTPRVPLPSPKAPVVLLPIGAAARTLLFSCTRVDGASIDISPAPIPLMTTRSEALHRQFTISSPTPLIP